MIRVLRKMPNWKAPGLENIEGYWLRNFTPLHDKLVVYLQDSLDCRSAWLVDKKISSVYTK